MKNCKVKKHFSEVFKIIVFFIAIINFGCASGSLFVDSSPQGSKVYLKPVGGTFQEIGATPLTKSLSEIITVNGAADAVLLEVRKEGFVSEQIVITDVVTRSDLKVTVSLDSLASLIEQEQKRQLSSDGKSDAVTPTVGITQFNEVIDRLFEVQRLVKVGRTDEALKLLDEVRKVNSQLAVVYEMQGGIAFLKKDYYTAFDAYTLAVKYNPENVESVNMRNYVKSILEKQSGTRVPATQ